MTTSYKLDELLTTKETADILGVGTNTLEMWRWKRKGPPFVRLGDAPGAAIRYPRSELMEWVDARSSAQAGADHE